MKMANSKVSRKNRKKPERHHYSIAVIISLAIVLAASVFYVLTSFSSVQQSVNELEKYPDVKNVYYKGDKNKLFVECVNGKQLQIELEDSLKRYAPVVSDFCR